jgi:hypothetical protein
MSSETTYAPGTLFRIYSTAESPSISLATTSSKHYTAVLLKDGKVLEVKNPDTGKKETFPSLTMWRASHGATEDDVKVDSSNGNGIVIGSDTNGFNYPNENLSSYSWVRWLYKIVDEAAPQLLKSEEFKTLYNQMVELCNKHKQELRHWDCDLKGKTRYSAYNLKSRYAAGDKWDGYPGHFYYEKFYYARHSGNDYKYYSNEDYEVARNEFVSVYKKIYEIVQPVISDYMTKKHNILSTQSKIARSKANIKKYEKKTTQLESSIKWYKSTIQTELANIAKYEAELITAQMTSL